MERVPNTFDPMRSPENVGTIGPGETGVGGFFLGVLTGVAVAGALTLLYAPKSGKDTREMLKNEYYETQRMLQNWSNDVRERMNHLGQIIRFSTSPGVQTTGDGHDKEY